MLTKQQKQLLSRMRADNLSSPPPFRTLGHWEKIADKFNNWFNELGIGDVVNQKYNEHFSGEPRRVETTERFLDYMTGGEWRDTRKLARQVLSIKLNNHGKTAYALGGYEDLSWGMLTAVDALYSIVDERSSPNMTVVDVGAGWGRMGYILQGLSGGEDHRYIIYDLPESLLISQAYLPVMLPNVYHGDYNELDDRPGCYYLPTHRILDLPDKSADIIINIASFQEMSDDYINLYFDIIDKKGKFLYTLQRGDPDKRPKCPALPHWELLFSRHPIWSGGHYEAMFKL